VKTRSNAGRRFARRPEDRFGIAFGFNGLCSSGDSAKIRDSVKDSRKINFKRKEESNDRDNSNDHREHDGKIVGQEYVLLDSTELTGARIFWRERVWRPATRTLYWLC
jgi:hypothetical protein